MVGFGAGIWPTVKVIADGNDISRFFSPRVSTISVTDEVGLEADKLDITFPAGQFAIPSKGAEIEVFLGYLLNLKSMGKFVVDTRGGDFVSTVKVSGSAAARSENTAGRSLTQAQKSRHFPEGTSLGDLIATIAGDNGLEPSCAPSLSLIQLPHLIQRNESDFHFLTRIASRHGATVKPASGRLICVKRGTGTNIQDEEIAPFVVGLGSVSKASWDETDSETAGAVVAKYRDAGAAETLEVKAGEGDTIRTLPQVFASQTAAQDAAQAMLDRLARSSINVKLTMPGDPEMFAGRPIQLVGLAEGIPTDLTCNRVTHRLGAQGYAMEIDAEAKV